MGTSKAKKTQEAFEKRAKELASEVSKSVGYASFDYAYGSAPTIFIDEHHTVYVRDMTETAYNAMCDKMDKYEIVREHFTVFASRDYSDYSYHASMSDGNYIMICARITGDIMKIDAEELAFYMGEACADWRPYDNTEAHDFSADD